ncbi:amidohydrolase [Pedobacter rhizosphaerae]|uniref:Cytosine/adenosine deaminase n=1 Tax=Pedobacter rhizosphaerae TaxID=390241 RepID=A0A1H9QXS0_9SPHI|nr:amidohydrolase [Pedobacter rhizosphaerae]SER65230.1 Cytosine/adenosine deaminase [Pedobacter rhizosphaerae]
MTMNALSRKKFIQQTMGAVGGSILASSLPTSILAMETAAKNQGKGELILKNVRLETGFIRDDFEITGTKTELFTVTIENGKFKSIKANSNLAGAIDAKGYLLLPAMRDMHIHLDKTFYGGKWKARSKRQKSVKDMITLEEQILPELLKTSTQHAERIIELLQSKGSNFARSHVNIEPTSKLDSLKNLNKAIENKKNSFGTELVAFPQHGVFYSKSESWMKEAAQMNIDFIGGLDPFSIDGSIEKTIDFTVQLALDHNKGIDIHLHESGESGLKTIEYLTAKVKENPALKGKTFLSHCFALGNLESKKLEETCTGLAEAQIGVISTIPFGRLIMPIPTLYKHGIKVMTGTDSVVDHWSPFGSGSMLQKANLMAQLYGSSSEFELSRCLRIATNDVLPLNEAGEQQWPKVGDNADFNLIDASCSAEAVARNSSIKALYHKGVLV